MQAGIAWGNNSMNIQPGVDSCKANQPTSESKIFYVFLFSLFMLIYDVHIDKDWVPLYNLIYHESNMSHKVKFIIYVWVGDK